MSPGLAIAIAIIRDRYSLEIQRLWADVLLMRPLNGSVSDGYSPEVKRILQFAKDLVVQIGLSIESLDTPVIELQVEREIVICLYRSNLIHLFSIYLSGSIFEKLTDRNKSKPLASSQSP